MDRSPGFGSMLCDLFAQLRLGFPSAPHFLCLTMPHHVTRRTVLQKVRGWTFNSSSTVCKHMVSGSLSLPSQGSFHLSFTVLYAIGHWLVFSLGGWSPRLPAGFLVSRSTPDTTRCNSDFEYKAFTFFGQAFLPVLLSFCSLIVVHYPEMHASRFRLFPFRSPLLRKSMFLSLPPGT